MCKAADLQDSKTDIFCPYTICLKIDALVVTVNKTAGPDKRTLCLSPLCLVLIKTNWVVNLVCSQQTPISERERVQEGETILEGKKHGGTVNHWVHMEECHLVNMVPGRLMIPAGEQASHRPRRKRLSPTITPALSLFYVLEDHSGCFNDSSLIIGQLRAFSTCCCTTEYRHPKHKAGRDTHT